MKRPAVLGVALLLPFMSACGEDEPQFMGTAHVLRVLENIETQQSAAAERLAAILAIMCLEWRNMTNASRLARKWWLAFWAT